MQPPLTHQGGELRDPGPCFCSEQTDFIKRANELQALVAAQEELEFVRALLTEKEKGGHREPTSGPWVWDSQGQLPASKGGGGYGLHSLPSPPLPHPPAQTLAHGCQRHLAREMEERRKEETLSSTEADREVTGGSLWSCQSLGYVSAGLGPGSRRGKEGRSGEATTRATTEDHHPGQHRRGSLSGQQRGLLFPHYALKGRLREANRPSGRIVSSGRGLSPPLALGREGAGAPDAAIRAWRRKIRWRQGFWAPANLLQGSKGTAGPATPLSRACSMLKAGAHMVQASPTLPWEPGSSALGVGDCQRAVSLCH